MVFELRLHSPRGDENEFIHLKQQLWSRAKPLALWNLFVIYLCGNIVVEQYVVGDNGLRLSRSGAMAERKLLWVERKPWSGRYGVLTQSNIQEHAKWPWIILTFHSIWEYITSYLGSMHNCAARQDADEAWWQMRWCEFKPNRECQAL